jgi:hypothetical protein
LILQESITAENRKLFSENDEAQAQKLNQGRIIIKIGIFYQNFNCSGKVFFWFYKKIEKRLHILSKNMDIWVGFLKFAFFVNKFLWQNERFSPSVHFGGILDKGFVLKLHLTVPNPKVEINNLSKSGL